VNEQPNLVDIGGDVEVPTEVSERNAPATPETYDKRLVQDRTGLLMQAGTLKGDPARHRLDPRVHGPNGQILVCQRCKIEVFRVFVSGNGPYLQVICANEECGAMYPVLEMTPVQMTTQLAIAHQLPVPDHLAQEYRHSQMNREQRRAERFGRTRRQ